MSKFKTAFSTNPAARFATVFLVLFAVFYLACLANFKYTNPGSDNIPFLTEHLNLAHYMRWLLLHTTKLCLNILGYTVAVNEHSLLVAGHNMIILNYSCLGLGVMCFFAAFVLAFPKPWKQRLIFLPLGLIGIQVVNVYRLGWLALNWHKPTSFLTDQHTIFNITIYILVAITLYFWVNSGKRSHRHATNRSV